MKLRTIAAVLVTVIVGYLVLWYSLKPGLPKEWSAIHVGMTRKEVLDILGDWSEPNYGEGEYGYGNASPLLFYKEVQIEVAFHVENDLSNQGLLKNKAKEINVYYIEDISLWWYRVCRKFRKCL